MEYTLNIIQISISALLIITILLQSRGSGAGSAFGGGGGGGGESYYKKRGAEKILFTLSTILAVLFVFTAIIRMIVK